MIGSHIIDNEFVITRIVQNDGKTRFTWTYTQGEW